GRVESVIIGIGINVSTKEFPKELADTATGLYESGITEANLLNAVIKELIPLVQQPCREEILQEYKAHSLVLEKEITFIENGVSKRAKAIDIDETGGLVVMSEEGIRTLRSGEISIRLK
ncbi:MAG: biotin--[Clostridia bacterium]|nr:biotin--[acetyl-CoA-carboxylase] ligase [Clostridia bacterium]